MGFDSPHPTNQNNNNMKHSSKGFRGMIRDRLPIHVDIALQICKCKNKYVEHIYDRFVKCVPVNQRSLAVKQALGLKQAVTTEDIRVWSWSHGNFFKQKNYDIHNIPREMLFHTFWTSIDWDSLDKETFIRFSATEQWVRYLKQMYPVFENIYKINFGVLYRTCAQTIAEIHEKYHLDPKIIRIILKHIKQCQPTISH